ncbi:MAG TPA: alpha/beta hydrolase [Anaerolineales bacterium]|nr:alpha/beta hydrolase [Anaerolineales bacterium]
MIIWMNACTSLILSLALLLLNACSPVMQPLPSVMPLPTNTPTIESRPSPTFTIPSASQTPKPIVGKFDIGGRSLYLLCAGTGSPTIILESGWGADYAYWSGVIVEMSKTTRVCGYDRASMGNSDPAPIPRTGRDMMMDLHALLTAAKVPGPYVLVGHSLGGFLVRLYADEYPEEVIGMVLVDSSHPDQGSAFLAALPPEAPDESGCIRNFRSSMTEMSVADPREVPEGLDFETTNAQVRDLEPLGELPLGVVTAGLGACDFGAGAPAEAAGLGQAWQDLQKELTMLSSNSFQIIAERSGHMIPTEQPEAVIEAIKRVMEVAASR